MADSEEGVREEDNVDAGKEGDKELNVDVAIEADNDGHDSASSSSSLSESELIDEAEWGSPIGSFSCIAEGTSGEAELAEVGNDADETMNLFAVSWRSEATPTTYMHENLPGWIRLIREYGLKDTGPTSKKAGKKTMEKRAMEKEAMETLLSKLTSVSEKWVQSSNSLTYTSDLLIECELIDGDRVVWPEVQKGLQIAIAAVFRIGFVFYAIRPKPKHIESTSKRTDS